MSNLAEQMLARTNTIEDKDKLDILFNSLVLPSIEFAANEKRREVSFNSFIRRQADGEVQKIFPKVRSLQNLIETKMKPYLQEKGFKVALQSPSYYVYIRW